MNCFKIVFVFIMALQNVILLSVLLLFTNFSKFVFALENENACCKVGQVQGASAGHCLTLNVTSAVSKVTTTASTTGPQQQHSSDHFSCQLTAKMCCLQGQQAKLCKRVAREMMAQEPVDSLLGTALLQNRNRVRIDANASHLSELLTSAYSCDLKRNSDALCCLGCNLGLLWAVSRLAKLNGELPIQTLVSSLETVAAGNGTDNGTDWCTPSGTAHAVGQTVSESLGFRECCRQSLLAIHRNIRWCELKPAPCAHRCHEAVSEDGRSRVQCSCYEGYRLAEDGRSCVDADECAQLTHNCDPNYEVCHNTDGGFQCVARKTPLASELFPTSGDSGQKCSPGYYFNATEGRCKDIDECRHSLHECNLSRQVCRNLLGAYVCLDIGRGGQQQGCPSGFRPTSSAGSPLNCTDVDECAEGTYDCDRREQCENFIGSYTCEEKVRLRTDSGSSSTTRSSMVETENSSNSNLTNCAKGYHFVRFSYTCEDTNECRIGQHDCDLSRERCINFPGTYRCVPLVLGEGKGSGGGDSGDAGTGAEENDKQSSARLSSLRFTQKLCPSGYERNEELNICEDSDECNSGLLPPCSENAYCQNTIGSYVCHCKTGFIKPANDSHFCEDVNECTGGLHNCFGTLKCVNTVGSFECLPRQPDFVSSSSTLNERSQIGLYSEEKCDRGQIYDSTKKTCVGKSGGGEFELGGDQTGKSRQVRCESGERIIDGECRTVSCSTGFFYNSTERRCQDLNECLQYSPCSSAEKCTNTIGSYRCSIRCTAGYQKVNFGQSCEDVDECALGTYRCPAGQVCKNRPGGYTCQCPPGYLGSADQGGSGQCEDVDECISSDGQEVSVCGEHQLCINTPGSFRCQCKAGFREERAHFGSGPGTGALRCVDQDECDSSSSSGGYHHRCEHLCLNYAGSYKCACKSGFQLAADGFTCVDINECETLGKPKSSDSKESNNRTALSGDAQVCYHKCINQPGSFQCTCPPGYESLSEGRICKDIDECESGELCRGQNEYCLNVHGSYRCNVINCPDDYYLDARSKKCIRHAPKNPSENYDINLPLSYSYNYLGIVSNVRIPSSGHLDLLAMSGPVFSITAIKFELNVTSAKPHRYGVPPATREHFLLRRPSYDQIIVSLTKPIEGPQDIELVLTVSLYNEALFAGSTKAFINVVVSEYEF